MNIAVAHLNLATRDALAVALRARGFQVFSVPDVGGVLAASFQARLVLALVQPKLLARESVDLRAQVRAKAGYAMELFAWTDSPLDENREAFARHGAELLGRPAEDVEKLADWIKERAELRGVGDVAPEADGGARSPGNVAAAKAPGTSAPAPEATATVLVVEDERTFQLFVCLALSEQGYAVHAASNGREALEHLSQRKFDLVISDINMPGMDGFELKRNIDAMKDPPPFILMTGDSRRDNVESAGAMGIHFVLVKPFRNMEALYAIVAEALKTRRS